MKWIIQLLDFRLWNGAGQGGGGGGGGGGDGQGGGGEPGYGSQRQRQRPGVPVALPGAAPTPAPEPPPEEPGPITHAQFARGLEDVRQRNRIGPMPAMAQDYELPDTAFGSRIY